jgi:hypothetical protein
MNVDVDLFLKTKLTILRSDSNGFMRGLATDRLLRLREVLTQERGQKKIKIKRYYKPQSANNTLISSFVVLTNPVTRLRSW